MNRFLFLLLFSACILSCGKSKPRISNKPDWLIDQDKMVEIITDLQIVSSATYIVNNAPPRDKSKDIIFVMKKHKVNDSIFRKSQDYYAMHPEVAEKIYEQVIDRISEMEAENSEGQ